MINDLTFPSLNGQLKHLNLEESRYTWKRLKFLEILNYMNQKKEVAKLHF